MPLKLIQGHIYMYKKGVEGAFFIVFSLELISRQYFFFTLFR